MRRLLTKVNATGQAIAPFDPCAAWALHASVAVRPERFGALLYDFRTRQLTFVKNVKLVRVLDCLPKYPNAHDACLAAGVDEDEREQYLAALARLAQTQMLEQTSHEQAV